MAGLALFAIGTLAMIWIVLPLWITSVRRRTEQMTLDIAALEATVRELRADQGASAARGATRPVATASPAPIAPHPPAPAPSSDARPAAPVAAPAPAVPPRPLSPDLVASEIDVPRPAQRTPPLAREPGPTAPTAPTAPTTAWEVAVGTSWLNKIGVLVVVVGVALFLGYSMAHVGPGGRVAIGYALAGALLATGVVLERRLTYANYAYGLIAGGWAGVYFTTYATHAVEAAHILDSELVATSALVVVAAGMIAHSLKYRSRTVTTLAFVVAYATLLLTPLTGFSIVAAVPLSASLLVIAERLGWSSVSVFGLVATYGLFAIRTPGAAVIGGAAIQGDVLDSASVVPYLALATYWVTFEAADLLGSRLRRSRPTPAVTPIFALNAVGFVGAALLQLPPDDPQALSVFLGAAGLAYIASALARGRHVAAPAMATDTAPADRFGGVQCAVAIAAALFAWSIDLRFSGPRETLALLLEVELLVAAGMALSDGAIRQTGSFVATLVTGHALAAAIHAGAPVEWLADTSVGTLVACVAAAAWYGNREWLRARGREPGTLEPGYTWAALLIVLVAILREATPVYQGLGSVIVGAALLEAGLRRDAQYRYQSYMAGALGGMSILMVFAGGLSPTSTRDVWAVLSAASVLGYVMAARAASRARANLADELVLAAGFASTLAAACILVLEWRVLAPVAVAPAWAAFGLVLLAAGVWRHLAGLRWQAYVVMLIAGREILVRLFEPGGAANDELTAGAMVVALLYLSSAAARREARAAESGEVTAVRLERLAAIAVSLTGTALLLVLQWRGLDPLLVGPGRAVTGAVILGLGLRRGVADLRWQAYGLLALGGLTTMQPILAPGPATPPQIAWMAIVVGLLYAAGLASRATVRALPASPARDVERFCRIGLSVLGGALLTSLVFLEVQPSLITLAWGIIGATLLGLGFPLRERVLRLSGLALLFLCIAKLFAQDVWELEAVVRIVSFMLLGLVLLAVSWVYTRYSEQIRRFL